MNNLRVFGLGTSKESKQFAQQIAKFLGERLTRHNEGLFTDGEIFIKSKENVRNCDCFIVSSLYGDDDESVNEKIIKLMWFVGSLVDATANSITIIAPYLSYQRQDRKVKSREGVVTKYLAQTLSCLTKESNFTTLRQLTMDTHNLSALQNSNRIPTDNLEGKNLLVDFICGGTDRDGYEITDHIPDPLIENPNDLVIVSPDSGGMGRAKRFRNSIEKRLGMQNKIDTVSIDKERVSGDEVKGDKVAGDVEGKRAIIVDDMIASGGTIINTKKAIEKAGGEIWGVCATHGLFVGDANNKLNDIERLIITDTIAPFRMNKDQWKGRLFVVRTAPLFARAIKITHEGGSISELLES